MDDRKDVIVIKNCKNEKEINSKKDAKLHFKWLMKYNKVQRQKNKEKYLKMSSETYIKKAIYQDSIDNQIEIMIQNLHRLHERKSRYNWTKQDGGFDLSKFNKKECNCD